MSSTVRGQVSITASCALVLCAAPAGASVTAGFCVKVGDTVGARTISTLGEPFTNSAGKVGFVMSMNDSTRSIWYDTGEVFNSSAALPDVLTGGEDTMGISDTGGFLYSPSFNTLDAVYSHVGKVLADDDVFPPDPLLFSSFNSRPRMSANGTAWWVGGWATTLGGATAGRALLKNTTPGIPSAAISVLKSGDMVGGLTLSSSGVGFAYDISDNANHYVNSAVFTGVPTTADTGIIVDGVLVAREGDPDGAGDNWQNWRFVGINDSGNYTIIGDSSGTVDDFVTFNATIMVRQGDTLDGQLLGTTVDMVSINNLNRIAMIWDLASGSGQEGLFVGDGASLLGATLLLQTGDTIDVTGDMVDDFTVTDFNASATIAPGLDLSDTGLVYVNVDLTPIGGGSSVEAIIGVDAGGGPPPAAYCFGDGSGAACPCGNNSSVGADAGCLSSLGTGGKLVGAGASKLSSDSLVLLGSGMPNSSALYFQGTAQQSGGLGAAFGDGLRCAGGSVVRLGTKTNVAGVSQYPVVGDLSVSVRGLVVAPGTRDYQIWYRNAAAFCTPSTFNLSNGLEVTWIP